MKKLDRCLTKLFAGADPYILEYNGRWYLYCTTENAKPLEDERSFNTDNDVEDGIFVYASYDLENWENLGLCLNKKDVIGEKWFWAPEVIYHNGRFYMTYSAEEHIAVAVSDRPEGPFVQNEKKWLREGKAIDGDFLVDDDGSVWLYFAKLDGGNKIFVAKLSDDLLSIEKEYENCLIEPEMPWETIDSIVAEGPFAIKHNGIYYLSYSANHTRNENYAVGYAVSKSPTGPFTKYEGNPILSKNGKIKGTGHHSLAKVTDNEYICAFHCHSVHDDDPDNFKPRLVCLAPAKFEKTGNGTDVLKIEI